MKALVDHFKQNRPYVFPDKVHSTRVIFDGSRFTQKPKPPVTSFSFQLPVVFMGCEPEFDSKSINKRYSVQTELVQSTFADLLIVM